ncbi:hypothetical protein P7C70_g3281, partial [Phenoliferia sp. Uapishka_3]
MSDIDTIGNSLNDFSSTFPLPFRVLFLTVSIPKSSSRAACWLLTSFVSPQFATVGGFATNLHLLAYLGIDTSLVLDIRLDDYRGSHRAPSATPAPFVHPSRLFPPIYSLAFCGLAWTTASWLVFARITGGVPEEMVKWRAIPAVTAIAVGLAAIAPFNVLHRKERMMFLRSLRRTIFSSLYSAVPFSDIILADILTSSAKVLGDVWVSGCLLFTVTQRFGMGGDDAANSGCARVFMVPVMTRYEPFEESTRMAPTAQCISEVVTGSTPTPRKSMMNALKYATAFPVIFFSAMQTVLGDPFDEVELEAAKTAWIGRTTLFNVWILAVLVNSLYSFWWDVTNDWGLSLLSPSGWSKNQNAYAFIHPPTPANASVALNTLPATGARRGSVYVSTPHTSSSPSHSRVRINGQSGSNFLAPDVPSTAYPPPPSRPHSPSTTTLGTSPSKSYNSAVVPPPTAPTSSLSAPSRPSHHRAYSTASAPNLTFPFLRPILLLPDPTIYYLAIFIDLILRFTWSLKLSSHLHSIHEMESGIFVMEALEVVRRWMWVFLRVEWEAVRKGGGGLNLDREDGENRLRMQDEEDELGRIRARDSEDGIGLEEEIGLGILVQKSVSKH